MFNNLPNISRALVINQLQSASYDEGSRQAVGRQYAGSRQEVGKKSAGDLQEVSRK